VWIDGFVTRHERSFQKPQSRCKRAAACVPSQA
jgi:hypothetical protein